MKIPVDFYFVQTSLFLQFFLLEVDQRKTPDLNLDFCVCVMKVSYSEISRSVLINCLFMII